MTYLRRSFINMLSGTVGWAAPTVVNLAATPFLLNRLGHAAYGIQSLVSVVTGYVVLMDLGLDIPVTKFLAEDRGRKDERSAGELATVSFQLYGILGILGAVLIYLSAGPLSSRVFEIPRELQSESKLVFEIAAAAFFVNVIIIWGRAVACGFQRYDVASGTQAAASVAGLVAGIVSVVLGFGVVGFVAARTIISSLAALFYIFTVRRWVSGFWLGWKISTNVLSRIRSYLASGIVLRMAGMVVSSLDRSLIAAWLGVSALTTYAIPSLIAMSFTQLVGSAIHFTLPMASEFHGAGQKDLLQQLFTKASRFVVFFSTGWAVMLLTLGDKLLTIWVGPGISASARTVLMILVAAAYLQAVTIQLANNAALGMGYIGGFTLYSAIRASLIAVGCVALIRPLGLEGAAVAIISATVVDVFYMARVVRKYLNLSFGVLFRNAYAKPLSLGLVTAMLAIACRPLVTSWISFGVAATALLGFYVAVADRIGVLEDSEKRALRELLKGVVHARTQA